jgi:hypothetical protein
MQHPFDGIIRQPRGSAVDQTDDQPDVGRAVQPNRRSFLGWMAVGTAGLLGLLGRGENAAAQIQAPSERDPTEEPSGAIAQTGRSLHRGRYTTYALGEEGGPYTTYALGEEGAAYTTFALGEEGSYTTFALGEEGGIVTTYALGEEGGPNTTFALGEEGSGNRGSGRYRWHTGRRDWNWR